MKIAPNYRLNGRFTLCSPDRLQDLQFHHENDGRYNDSRQRGLRDVGEVRREQVQRQDHNHSRVYATKRGLDTARVVYSAPRERASYRH